MKVRNGFVSNSSSSSFVLSPTEYTIEQVKNIVETAVENYLKDISEFEYRSEEETRNSYKIFVLTEELYDDFKHIDFFSNKAEVLGSIVVDCVADNSIPSEILDELEYTQGWLRHYSG